MADYLRWRGGRVLICRQARMKEKRNQDQNPSSGTRLTLIMSCRNKLRYRNFFSVEISSTHIQLLLLIRH